MQEDYIEEDFLEEESPSNRRPFLVAVGVLVTLFILMGACTAFFLVNNRAAQDRAQETAAIETRNAETLASNAATAIAATEAAAVAPTNTPEPTVAPTNTPEPATLTPTSTPVVDSGAEEAATTEASTGDGETATAEAGDGTAVATSEAIITDGGGDSGEATATPISALSDTSDGTNDALPQTGLDTWGILVAALVLVGVLIFARRLRTAG